MWSKRRARERFLEDPSMFVHRPADVITRAHSSVMASGSVSPPIVCRRVGGNADYFSEIQPSWVSFQVDDPISATESSWYQLQRVAFSTTHFRALGARAYCVL